MTLQTTSSWCIICFAFSFVIILFRPDFKGYEIQGTVNVVSSLMAMLVPLSSRKGNDETLGFFS